MDVMIPHLFCSMCNQSARLYNKSWIFKANIKYAFYYNDGSAYYFCTPQCKEHYLLTPILAKPLNI